MVIKLRELTLLWVCMLLFLPVGVMAAESETSAGEANTYYEKGTTTKLTLGKRMALVGHNCMVNRLAGGIEVGSGSANLNNLCDDDLTNSYTITSTISATLLAGNPIEETDGNLGDEDSEVSGAKGHNAWSNWED